MPLLNDRLGSRGGAVGPRGAPWLRRPAPAAVSGPDRSCPAGRGPQKLGPPGAGLSVAAPRGTAPGLEERGGRARASVGPSVLPARRPDSARAGGSIQAPGPGAALRAPARGGCEPKSRASPSKKRPRGHRRRRPCSRGDARGLGQGCCPPPRARRCPLRARARSAPAPRGGPAPCGAAESAR